MRSGSSCASALSLLTQTRYLTISTSTSWRRHRHAPCQGKGRLIITSHQRLKLGGRFKLLNRGVLLSNLILFFRYMEICPRNNTVVTTIHSIHSARYTCDRSNRLICWSFDIYRLRLLQMERFLVAVLNQPLLAIGR